ncbi:MAG: mitotic cohesin complex, non-SMC subunit Psc3 [Amphiamblys sp. WSBS2006]|nr:MAG: mitotic cohesin complex, non-SMC subunit Psc3 [Amphiamblys sp. WSBS2006]
MSSPIRNGNTAIDDEDIIATQIKKNQSEHINTEDTHNILYDALSTPQTAISLTLEEWLGIFETDPDEAARVFFSFLLLSSGGKKEWAGDETNIDVELQRLGEGAAKEYTGNVLTTKQAKTYRKNTEEFFKRLIQDGDPEKTAGVLDRVSPFVHTMSNSQYRPFRHLATHISMAMMKHTAQLLAHIDKTEPAKKKQNKKEASVAERLKEAAESFFNGVFMHRYRDIDSAIRQEALIGLTKTILLHPKHFLEGIYLRYIGWLLSDRCKDVRLEAIRSFGMLVDCGAPVVSFFERFMARFIEICFHDTCDIVRLAAVDLLFPLHRIGVVSETQETELHGLVFDTNQKIAKRFGPFAAQLLQQHPAVQEKFSVAKSLPIETQKRIDAVPGGFTFVLVFIQCCRFLRQQADPLGDLQTYAVAFTETLADSLPTVKNFKGIAEVLLMQREEVPGLEDCAAVSEELLPCAAALFLAACQLHISPRSSGPKKRKAGEGETENAKNTLLERLPEILTQRASPAAPAATAILVRAALLSPLLSTGMAEAQKRLEELLSVASRMFLQHTEKDPLEALGSVLSKLKEVSRERTEHEIERLSDEIHSIAVSTLGKITAKNKKGFSVLAAALTKLRVLSSLGHPPPDATVFLPAAKHSQGKKEHDDLFKDTAQILSCTENGKEHAIEICTQTLQSGESVSRRLFSLCILCDASEQDAVTDSLLPAVELLRDEVIAMASAEDEEASAPPEGATFRSPEHPFFSQYAAVKLATVLLKTVLGERLPAELLIPFFSLYGRLKTPFSMEKCLKTILPSIKKRDGPEMASFIKETVRQTIEESQPLSEEIIRLLADALPTGPQTQLDLHLALLNKINADVECDDRKTKAENYKRTLRAYEKHFAKNLSDEARGTIEQSLRKKFEVPAGKKSLYVFLVTNMRKILDGEKSISLKEDSSLNSETTPRKKTRGDADTPQSFSFAASPLMKNVRQ